MNHRSRSILILAILSVYILLQFISWEILFVRKTGEITELKQKLAALTISDPNKLQADIAELSARKTRQVIMIVSEGTVFLLLLLFGIYKLRQAYYREFEISSQQKNFFLSITHELKTPIAAAKLQLQTLIKHRLNEEKRKELLEGAIKETERLNTLLDNVLLASRLDATGFQTQLSRQNISALSKEIIQRYFPAAVSRGELKAEIADDVYCMVDSEAFTSVLSNLVDNAIKYSFKNIDVLVTLAVKTDHAVLRVCDKGIGIEPGNRKKIFARFFRIGNEETRSARGTGLGLYIVDFLVKQMKGSVSVKENSPRGSIFEVRFPAV